VSRIQGWPCVLDANFGPGCIMAAVSFTVRRPTPTPISNDSSDVEPNTFKVPAIPSRLKENQSSRSGSPLNPNGKRPLAFNDSDEEEDLVTEELVVGFDAMGAQRWVEFANAPHSQPHHSPKSSITVYSANGSLGQREHLVIPSLPDKDWRAAALKKKGYVPDEGKMTVGADGSQGGLGTRDMINSGPQQSGLIVFKKRKIEDDDDSTLEGLKNEIIEESEQSPAPGPELTEEQRAVNALIAAAKKGDGDANEEMVIDAIPVAPSEDWRVMSETEAYREDVAGRPDSSTAEDYKKVPVSQFGTALLLGMGWKPGQGISKSGKGPTEAFVPKARPALLGLGAKPSEATEAGSNQRGGSKPSKRYVPVVAKERSQGDEKSSRNESRQTSERKDRPRDSDHRDRRDRDYERDRSPDSRDRGYRSRDRSRDRRDDNESSRSYKERDDRYRDRHRDSARDKGSSHRRRDEDDGRYSSRDDKYRERRDDRRDDRREDKKRR
jgi:hypothetical protein